MVEDYDLSVKIRKCIDIELKAFNKTLKAYDPQYNKEETLTKIKEINKEYLDVTNEQIARIKY